MQVMQNPKQYKIPNWFLNRQKDVKDGKYSQVLSTQLDNKLREDLERLKKIRLHRGLRHYWGSLLLPLSPCPEWRRRDSVGGEMTASNAKVSLRVFRNMFHNTKVWNPSC